MAFDSENLKQIEIVYGFKYPPAFWQRREELVALATVEPFGHKVSSTRLIETHEEIRALRQAYSVLPDDFIPFMVTGDAPFPDFYGFEISSRGEAGPAVLAWSIHAYVHQWDTGFNEFLDDVAKDIESHDL